MCSPFLLTLCILQLAYSDIRSHNSGDRFNSHVGTTDSESDNFYLQTCTFDRQCDEDYGYVCKEGRCACRYGRPDSTDGFKCKVEVRLGDFCKEFSRGERDRRFPYIRRKCPHYAECSKDIGICVCNPWFERKGSDCVPRVLKAGGKSCKDHLECLVERGQQCYRRTCVECAAGRFRNYRPTAKWVTPNPECICFDRVSEWFNNSTTAFGTRRYQRGSCISSTAMGDHCTTPQNCVSPYTPRLTCLEGTCQCPPGSREFLSTFTDPPTTRCIVTIDSSCTDSDDCHPHTAYCERRLEFPKCKCKEGYEITRGDPYLCISRYHEETCGKFLPLNERRRDELSDQKLICNEEGIFTCIRPREMFWDKERGKCVSYVGSRCEPELSEDISNCAGQSRCWEHKATGELRCQCPLSGDSGNETLKLGDITFRPSKDRKQCISYDR